MTQSEINCAVATATGETLCTISELGFSIADPDVVDFDPEPCDLVPQTVDWDELALHRNTPLVPAFS